MNSRFSVLFILCVSLGSSAVCDALAEPQSSVAEQAASLVQEVLADPGNPVKYFGDTAIDGQFYGMAPFRKLTQVLATANLLDAWKAIPNDRSSQVVFMHALRDVPGTAYLTFGDTALEALKERQIDHDLFVLGYLLPNHRKQWLFSSNFENPKVKAFISKVRSQLQADADIVAWADNVLSGKHAKRDQMLRAENPNARNEELELLTDSKTDTSTASDQRTKQTVLAPPTAKKINEAKSAAPTPSEEPKSSTPWSVVVVMIVAALGLLWLVLKRRS